MSSQPRVCPICGTPPPSDAPEGFCPRCSFGGALKLEPGEELITTQRLEPSADSSPLTTRRAAPLAGISLGDYELLEEIAAGGMGIVYKARQRSLDRIVAVKTLLFGPQAKPEFIKRFHAEAAAAASLQHPNIVSIHEVGVQEGQHYFVMDYVEGQTLAEVVSKTPLPAKRAAGYVKRIAEAIHYAHERGILHRDLKPSNVLIDAQDQPRVTDFGLAKRFEGGSELTLSGQVVGSPGYLPPEQAEAKRGKVSRRSDVYGLGAILYHLLTGRAPFQAETLTELLRQVVENEPVSPRLLNPSIPRDLETICLKCMEKEPARRYATAQTVAEELGRFLADEPVMARPVGPAGKTWRWCRRKPVLAGLGSAVLILLLVVGVGSPLALVRINRARLAALDQTRLAQSQELKARQHEYVADMNLAQHALAMSNLGRARRLLEKYHPTNYTLSSTSAQGSTDLRGWEWRYLWAQCQSDALFTLCQNAYDIGVVAFAGNGQLLVARDEYNVLLFDIPTRQEIARLPSRALQFRAMAVSPDGNLLAHGRSETNGARTVELWDVRTRLGVGQLPHPEGFVSLAFSPDGKSLASFSGDRTVRIWDVGKAQVLASFPASPLSGDYKGVVAFSPDGGTLAIGETDGRIRLITLAAGTTRADYHAQPNGEGITALAFSADSKIVASGSGYSDGTIRLWDARTGQSVGQLVGHTSWIVCLVLSPDGQTLASASGDQTIRLWNLASRQCRGIRRGHTTEVYALAFSPDGKSLASGDKDGSICLWNPNGESKPDLTLTLPTAVNRLVFSPENQTFHTLNLDGSISLWDAATAQKTATHAGLGTNNASLAISPDGNLLVAGTSTGAIRIWGRLTERELTNFTAHAAQIEHLQYRVNGRVLVSAARDGVVKLWDAVPWREQKVCRTAPEFRAFDTSADARLAAVVWGSVVEVWDLAQNRRLTSLGGDPGSVDSVAFSRDGRLLATASQSGSVILYEVSTWREVARLRGVLLAVHSVAFAPDGRRLVTGSLSEEAVKLWDLATLQELVTFQAEGAWRTAFSPDGNTLVGVSQEGTAYLWRAPPPTEIDAKSVERSR